MSDTTRVTTRQLTNQLSYIQDKLLLIDAQLHHLDNTSPIVQRIRKYLSLIMKTQKNIIE